MQILNIDHPRFLESMDSDVELLAHPIQISVLSLLH